MEHQDDCLKRLRWLGDWLQHQLQHWSSGQGDASSSLSEIQHDDVLGHLLV